MWTSHEAPPRTIRTRLRAAHPPAELALRDTRQQAPPDTRRQDLDIVRAALQAFPEALAAVVAAFNLAYGFVP